MLNEGRALVMNVKKFFKTFVEEDKKLLQEGIQTDNLSDALQIIEDYLS